MGRRVPRFAERLARAACKQLRRLAEPSAAWPDEPVWRLFPSVLALAFAVRAAVALSEDFLLRPDEVIQYLEPAHRAVFGNGYWEQFYGARPWLLPGFIAGLLTGFAAIGWDQPAWYVPAVKLVFCPISLGIPAGMYFFAKRIFGEASARVALLAGAPSTVSVAVAAMLDRLGQRPFQPFPQLAAGRHQFTAIQARVFLAVFVVCWLAGFLAHYPRHPRARASKPFPPKTLRRHFQNASHGAICGPHLAPVQNEQNLFEQMLSFFPLSFFPCHGFRPRWGWDAFTCADDLNAVHPFNIGHGGQHGFVPASGFCGRNQ